MAAARRDGGHHALQNPPFGSGLVLVLCFGLAATR